MGKKILIIRCHKDICGEEIGIIETQCQFLCIDFRTEELIDPSTLEDIFKKYEEIDFTFDFIYVCSHGDSEGFEVDMGVERHDVSWANFGGLICSSDIINQNTIFLLACCRGGFFNVATDLMAVCEKIGFVCGVKWKIRPLDMVTGFSVLLYSLVFKRSDLSYACQKATLATDFTFSYYDRSEIEYNPQFLNRQHQLYRELGWVDEANMVITNDEEVLKNTKLVSHK